MSDRRLESGGGASHRVRLWRWVLFDPPLRDRRAWGCRTRRVTCADCDRDLGATDDPFDGVLLAWRHRRAVRAALGAPRPEPTAPL